MKATRISTIIGTREERAAVHAQRAASQRQATLSRMNPEQRAKFVAREQQQAAQQKQARNVELVKTRGFVGSKEERQNFRAEQQAARRELALERMTPEQREKALTQESQAKEAQAAKAKAKEQQEQRAKDDKTRRTVGKVGNKEEREASRSEKKRVAREDALKGMSQEQREQALAREAAAKEAREQQAKRERDAKARRTVAIVGDDQEREAFQKEKARVNREDILSSMTPEEQKKALEQEAAARQAQAIQEQQKQRAKEERTVAIVGDKERRDSFGGPVAPRGTATTVQPAGLALSAARLNHELGELNSTIALLS